MLLANEEQRAIGIKYLSRIKEMFPHRKNAAQEAFDENALHMRKTICFHAGLKARHVEMKFSELTYTERKQVVVALNSLINFVASLPRFISDDNCVLNTNH